MDTRLTPAMLEACRTNHGPMLLALGWLFLSLAIITVFLRLYFRHCHRGGIHLDDWVMLSSLVSLYMPRVHADTFHRQPPIAWKSKR